MAQKKATQAFSSIQPVTSLEWPFNCVIIEGGSATVHTVKVPSDAPYASRSELICPNFKTVTAIKIIRLGPHKSFTGSKWSQSSLIHQNSYRRLCSGQRYSAFPQRNMQVQHLDDVDDRYHW